jgi:5-methylcytosine-specific restriction endonuclease McrA
LCAECTGSKEMRYEIRRKRYEEMRRPKAAAYQRDRYQRIGRHDRVKVKEYWIVRMGGKCIRCGLQFGLNWPSCVFDFHHKKPSEKGESVAKLLRCADKNRTKRELKKTVLLCSNCHRKEHNHG